MVAVQFLRSTNLTLALKSYKMPSYVIPSLFSCCQKNDECHGREEAFPKLRVCEAIQHVNVFWGIQQHANVWQAEFSPKIFQSKLCKCIWQMEELQSKKYRKTRRNLNGCIHNVTIHSSILSICTNDNDIYWLAPNSCVVWAQTPTIKEARCQKSGQSGPGDILVVSFV